MDKKNFIEFMLSCDVLRFGGFVTKSGRQTQYFVNTGNYRTGAQISELAGYYAHLIYETTDGKFDAMFGPAYKGIPLVTAVAISLYRDFGIDKPYFFNRKEAKDHGEGGSLVGYKPKDGDKIIIIEDVITAGTAVRETLPVLFESAKIEVNDIFISVNRCEKGTSEKTASQELFEQYGIKVNSVVNVCDIHDYLISSGQADLAVKMESYMEKYCVI